MRINPLLLDELEKLEIDKDRGLLFCLCFEHGLLETALASELLDVDDITTMRVRLVTKDIMSNTPRLILPLYAELEIEGYDLFYHEVAVKVTNNKARLVNTDVTKREFQNLARSIDSFNIDTLIDVTIDYYNNEQYAKNLPTFLAELGRGFYNSYKKSKSKLI